MRKLWLLGLMMALLVSCKEKEPTNDPYDPPVVVDYFPMKTGNYWIYNTYEVDTLGNVTDRGITDSIVITGDTVINGKTYHLFMGTNYPVVTTWGIVDILRDSGNYIVNPGGIIKFALNDFNRVLYSRTMTFEGDTIYTLDYKMENPDSAVTVPAGVFGVLNYKGTLVTPETRPGIPNPRYINTFYALEVGKVVETYFFLNNPNTFENRLVRYKAVLE